MKKFLTLLAGLIIAVSLSTPNVMASGKIEIQEVDYNQHTESVDLYLHIDNALPSITVNASS